MRPSPYPPNTLLLWVFDTTGSESERLKLANQLQMTEAALDALTHLIEARRSRCGTAGPT